MKAIIVGAGKVGYNIAQMLSYEGHDVTVIEIDEERLTAIEEHLDVQVINGNGASADLLRAAGVAEADLLAAVTERDELNMVACLIAKSQGVGRTIARVRNPEYVDFDQTTRKDALGIDLIINPEKVTAIEIAEMVTNAEAHDVEYFMEERVQLLELRMPEDAPVNGLELQQLDFSHPFLVVGILRNGKMIIPHGKDKILAGDSIFILGETKEMPAVGKIIGQKPTKIESVVILGGGRTGHYLAEQLAKKHVSVKIIDKDLPQCKRIAQELSNCLVIYGDGTDLQLLEDENVGDTDLFVALSGDDKKNMLVSLLAKHLGAKKTIAQISRSDYAPLLEKVGIDRAISPRLLTAGAILRFLRKGKVVSITLIGEAKAQMTELIVPDNYPYAGKKLKEIKIPQGVIIAAIAREQQVIIPRGQDTILPGDRVLVCSLPQAVKKVDQFFGGI